MNKRIPTIEWQVAGACNYDCSYCIQSKRYRRGRPSERALTQLISAFAQLPGQWEVKCSGGEAFAHPLFLQMVVPELMRRTLHRISVLTNFSSSRQDLSDFLALTRGRLSVFSASLHLEHTTLEQFVDKAEWFCGELEPSVRFVVNQVVLPDREADAARAKELFDSKGIRWFPQLYKVKGGVFGYTHPERLIPLTGRRPTPRQANVAPSYFGRLCYAGLDYFVVDKDGGAWSCRTAKRHGEGYLGNLHEAELKRFQTASTCPYQICPCTVPANRGMIDGVRASDDATTKTRTAGPTVTP